MSSDFERLLRDEFGAHGAEDVISQWVRYRDLVLRASESQNLTRLIEPREFLDGHVRDVFALDASGLVDYPAVDLGSGVGIPGIGMAILGREPWTLIESEGHKASFLAEALVSLGLGERNSAVHARIEGFLREKDAQFGSVVARAVGPVSRIYEWIRKCSTWNNLVLLKGPGWDEEWRDFQKGPRRHELRLSDEFSYSFLGSDGERRARRVVKLSRVKK